MSKENKSDVFAISKEQKQAALNEIAKGIQQQQWQAEYIGKQVDDLPELPEDATDEMKQERAKKRVQVDAFEQQVEKQVDFYNFCKNNL